MKVIYLSPASSIFYSTCVVLFQDLDLGVRTDGVRVANVVLPPWAKGESAILASQ